MFSRANPTKYEMQARLERSAKNENEERTARQLYDRIVNRMGYPFPAMSGMRSKNPCPGRRQLQHGSPRPLVDLEDLRTQQLGADLAR